MTLDQLLDLPTGLLVVLGVVILVELVLLVVGLIAWARTPDTHMPPPNKWLWLVLILFLQLLGPVIFLIARKVHARSVAAAGQQETAPPARHSARRTAADLLYGPREDDR